MSDRLSIFTLGAARIDRGEKAVVGLVSRKAVALLVYLACEGGEHGREALASLLWDELSLERALANLSVALSSLRKRLGPILDTTRWSVALKPELQYWVDALEFQAALDRRRGYTPQGEALSGDQALPLIEALALYRGDFLHGFFLRGARGFEEWALLKREYLRQLATEGMDRAAVHAMRRRESRDALSWAERLVRLDPLRERSHRMVMLLHARGGDWVKASAQYDRCERALLAELGVEPSFETRALEERIRQARDAPRSNLPPVPGPLFGRQAELEYIADRLADPTCRVLTLVGPGGAGKTHLAIAAAVQEVSCFLNGVFFVPMAAVPSADLLLPAVGYAVGFHSVGQRDITDSLAGYLREKEILIVLDNMEHLHGAADVLARLLAKAPYLKVLATSRQPLKLRGEWLLEVGNLSYPRAGQTASLGYAAIDLFLERARAQDPDFSLDGECGEHVARICQLVEGLPLAIELAASWVRTMDCALIAQRLAQDLNVLGTEDAGVPERHSSLRAAFGHSWNLLTREERQILARLAVFRGGFQRAAAEEVAEATTEMLSGLQDKSLLKRVTQDRYVMHEFLRQCALEKLAEEETGGETTRARHAEYFSMLLAEAEAQIKGARERTALQGISEGHANLVAAWGWAVASGSVGHLGKMLEPFARYLEVQGFFDEGSTLTAEAIASLRFAGQDPGSAGSRLLGRLLARRGAFLSLQSDHEAAQSVLEESLAILGGKGDERWRAYCLTRLADVHRWRRNWKAGEEYLDEALRLYSQCGDAGGMADVRNAMGNLHYVREKYALARPIYRVSLGLWRETGDRYGQARCLLNLGNIAYRLGEYEEAQRIAQQSLQISREIDDRRGAALALNNLGNAAHHLGDYARAEASYLESLAIKQQLGDRRGIANTLDNLGIIAAARGAHRKAHQRRREALALQRELGNLWGVANSLNGLGDIALAGGDKQGAERSYKQALQVAWGAEAAAPLEEALLGLAELCARRGDLRQALVLVALVRERPVSDRELQDRADALCTTWSEQAGPEETAAADSLAHELGLARQVEGILAKTTPGQEEVGGPR